MPHSVAPLPFCAVFPSQRLPRALMRTNLAIELNRADLSSTTTRAARRQRVSHCSNPSPTLFCSHLRPRRLRSAAADLEVDTDGGDVALGVGVISESQQQTRLAHARIADQKQLEQVVVLRCSADGRHDAGGRIGEEGSVTRRFVWSRRGEVK